MLTVGVAIDVGVDVGVGVETLEVEGVLSLVAGG